MCVIPSKWFVAMAALLAAASADAARLTPAQVQAIADTFASEAIASGQAVEVGVGVVKRDSVLVNSAYGLANVAGETPFSANTIFEIASNTKVFTTTLLGLDVVNHNLALDTTLQQLSARVGTTKPMTQKVDLRELADFTSGFPDLAPLCKKSNVLGCLPNVRPTQSIYTVADFLEFFGNTVPQNYNVNPPTTLTKLPRAVSLLRFQRGPARSHPGNP